MKFEIKNRWTAEIVFSIEAENWRFAVEAAIKAGANLSGADLSKADLSPIRNDFWDVLLRAPKEVDGLRKALVGGRVNGSTYEGECACLVGTIANIKGERYDTIKNLQPDSSRPIERFFLAIRKGDTPETNLFCNKAVEWIDDFLGNISQLKEAK